MNIQRKICAKTPGMALLYDGKIAEIGGLTEEMELEMKDGEVVMVYCVYLNLDPEIRSTDFFLFSTESQKLIVHSFGKLTYSFFKNMYLKVLSDPRNLKMDSFLEEFVGEYTSKGLMGDF